MLRRLLSCPIQRYDVAFRGPLWSALFLERPCVSFRGCPLSFQGYPCSPLRNFGALPRPYFPRCLSGAPPYSSSRMLSGVMGLKLLPPTPETLEETRKPLPFSCFPAALCQRGFLPGTESRYVNSSNLFLVYSFSAESKESRAKHLVVEGHHE